MQEFLRALCALCLTVPCILCGEIHPLEVHSYPERKIRVPAECINEIVVIVVIFCPASKKSKKQYTKRILPPFITPYCVIRRDLSLESLRQHPDGILKGQQGMDELGARDKRTVSRHLTEVKHLVREAGMNSAAVLAEHPSFVAMPARGLAEGNLAYLETMATELSRGAQRAKGAAAFHIPALLIVHLQGVREKHRGRTISMTSVLGAMVFHDTS